MYLLNQVVGLQRHCNHKFTSPGQKLCFENQIFSEVRSDLRWVLFPLWPAQHNGTDTKMSPYIWDIPLGLEDLFHLSSRPFHDPPVSQQEHVSSSLPLKFPMEMLVSSCIVVLLTHWPQTNKIFSTWTNQPFLPTVSFIHIIKINLEQLCSSFETRCLNNHIFSFKTHLLLQGGDLTLSPFRVMVSSKEDIWKKKRRKPCSQSE